MNEIDRVIHEPVRLQIMSVLTGVDRADFTFMLTTLGLSKGNLSTHIDRLERAKYVKVHKSFNGKMTLTEYSLTKKGQKALVDYWSALDQIRTSPKKRRAV
jgi:DNA-binding transcriptional ArsR family regulator